MSAVEDRKNDEVCYTCEGHGKVDSQGNPPDNRNQKGCSTCPDCRGKGRIR